MISAAMRNASSAKWGSHQEFRYQIDGYDDRREMMKKYVRRRKGGESEEGDAVMTVTVSGLRVCIDCQTSKTPLWRSGPSGPRSLCNACGIKYRKKRKGVDGDGEKTSNRRRSNGNTSPSVEMEAEQLKQKQRERQEKLLLLLLQHQQQSRSWRVRKPAIEEEGGGKEEAEAAHLLMALSTGPSVHSQ